MTGESDEGTRGLVVADRFELVQRLGRGGMGTVWRARDLMLEREVALKEVRTKGLPSGGDSAEETAGRRDLVLQEARALARINHPHVVTIHHIVAAMPYPWIVMELLPGRTLATRIGSSPVTVAEAVDYGKQILSALRAAHDADILHRDVKPANVLLRDGDDTAVLTDFGIARPTGGPVDPERIVGSPEYLAPERIMGSPGTASSDLWSLGVLLYTLTEGHPPFRKGEPHRTLSAVIEDPIPPPRQAGTLAPVLKRLLVKDPAARPDAEQLDELLAAAEVPESTTTSNPRLAPPPPPPPPPPGPLAGAPQAAPAMARGPYAPTGATYVPDVAAAGSGAKPSRRRGRRLASAGAAALTVGAVAAALFLWLPGSTGDDDGTGGDAAQPAEDERDGAEESLEPEPDAPEEVTPDEERDETPPESEEPEAPDEGPRPEDSPAPPGETEPDGPAEESGISNTWIAQLHSEPVASGTEERDRILATVRSEVPGADVLRSDDHASLVPGYWVFYVSDSFGDGRAAVEFCAKQGRTTANECVGRYVSDVADHRELVCHPDGGGTGRCEQ